MEQTCPRELKMDFILIMISSVALFWGGTGFLCTSAIWPRSQEQVWWRFSKHLQPQTLQNKFIKAHLMNTFLKILIILDEKNEFPFIVCAVTRLDDLRKVFVQF